MVAMLPHISIVIPVYNAEKEIEVCLRSIFQSRWPHFEVIAVDDCSTDNSAALARQYPCHVLSTGINSGPAKARNIGVRAAKADIIVFLDADTEVKADFLEQVYTTLQDKPEIDAVVAVPADFSLRRGRASDYNALRNHYALMSAVPVTDYFTTQMSAIRKSAFMEAGGFDEKYTGAEIEDIELGLRLRPNSVFIHKGIIIGHHFPPLRLILKKFIKRSALLHALLAEKKRLPRAHANRQRMFSVGMALLSTLSLSAAAFAHRVAGAVFGLSLALFIAVNSRMLLFMAKRRGIWYLGEALFFEYLFSLAIGIGGGKSRLCRR